MRILLADDDPDQLKLQRTILVAAGHEVQFAFDGEGILRCANLGALDLVIMDLRFPNAAGAPDPHEGLAAIRRLRESDCRAPILVLSGWPDDLYGEPEEQMISRVMIKPVRMAALLQAIAELT